MPRKTETEFKYEGFPSPNGTVVPDDVFDVLAPILSEAELRVLLYIIRRTFGFKKEADSISLSQMVDGVTTRDGRVLDRGTGMSRRGVMKGCAGLVEKKIVRVEKQLSDQGDNEINIYHLHFRGDDETRSRPDSGVGNNVPYGRAQRSLGVGNKVAPQQTVRQQTVLHKSNIRVVAHGNFVDERRDDTKAPTRQPARSASQAARPSVSQAALVTPMTTARFNEPEQRASRTAGRPVSVGESLKTRRGRPAVRAEDREILVAYLSDFAREMNDQAPLRVSVTRALNLLGRSGLPREVFLQRLYEARSLTKEYSATIQSTVKRNGSPVPVKAKMAYFFAVLEDLLGFKEESSVSPLH